MDLTIGSGWSFGGPYITPALAASRLRSERREIAPGVTSIARPEPFEHDTPGRRVHRARLGAGGRSRVVSRAGRFPEQRSDPAAAGARSARRAVLFRRARPARS